MIIHDYDPDTKSLANLETFYGARKKIVDKCLVLFSRVLFRFLLDRYDCSVIGSAGASNGDIYCMSCKDEKLAFYLSGIGSTIASSTCHEVYWQTGATRFIMFGSCGSLDREKTGGKFIIPTECYRGDGCSYYFAPPSDYLPVRNPADWRRFLTRSKFRMSWAGYGQQIPCSARQSDWYEGEKKKAVWLWKWNWLAWRPHAVFTAWNYSDSWKLAMSWMKTGTIPQT